MATRKVKRYDEGGTTDTEFGDLEGAIDAANAREVRAQFDANEAAKATPKAEAKAASAPKAEAKPAASAPAAKSTQYGASVKSLGSSLRFGSDKRTTHPEYPEDYKKPAVSKPAAKKEMYRGFDGKMHEKSTEPSASSGMGESISRGLKSAGEGISNYMKSLGKREEKHGTYVKDGKVVKYAKGGMTASARADGIASRGKTRGKIC